VRGVKISKNAISSQIYVTIILTNLLRTFVDKHKHKRDELLAPYLFCCFSSIIKTGLSAENTILLLFTLIASTNVASDRATAVVYVTPYW